MIAQQVLYRLLYKSAASLMGSLAKDITPAFSHDAEALGASIAHPPYLKPGIMNRLSAPAGAFGPVGGSIPRLQSAPALEAKSVFKAPAQAAQQAPTARIFNPRPANQGLQYDPRPQPAVGEVDAIHNEGEQLADKLQDPNLDPSSRVNMVDRLRKLQDQLRAGPALELTNQAGHRAALAARAEKMQGQVAQPNLNPNPALSSGDTTFRQSSNPFEQVK